jgi:hypothetical protein
MITAILAAGGIVRPDAGPPSTPRSGPQVTVVVQETLSCCGTNGDCCCVAAMPAFEEATVAVVAELASCCGHAEVQLEPRVAQDNEGLDPAMKKGCSFELPLCSCTAERRVPLEDSPPAGLPAPQAERDLCDGMALENRLASDELTLTTSCSGVLTAAAPLPLPVSVQLATLCCWRA